jgi:chromosome partitioning protein
MQKKRGSPWAGKVLVLASAKGGAGKTTIAAAIAGELLRRGERVALLDADPQESGGLSQWHSAGEAAAGLQAAELHREIGEGAADLAQQLAQSGAVVVCDAAGSLTRTTLALLEQADLVLVPARAGGLDAARAVEMVQLVGQASRAACAVVLNATTRSLLPAHIRAELRRAGVQVLRAEVGQRVAFPTAQLHGTTPAFLPGAAVARAEIESLVSELLKVLR